MDGMSKTHSILRAHLFVICLISWLAYHCKRVRMAMDLKTWSIRSILSHSGDNLLIFGFGTPSTATHLGFVLWYAMFFGGTIRMYNVLTLMLRPHPLHNIKYQHQSTNTPTIPTHTHIHTHTHTYTPTHTLDRVIKAIVSLVYVPLTQNISVFIWHSTHQILCGNTGYHYVQLVIEACLSLPATYNYNPQLQIHSAEHEP